METAPIEESVTNKQITIEDVKRLLEVGRLLFSVLTEEEIKELQELLSPNSSIGNAGNS